MLLARIARYLLGIIFTLAGLSGFLIHPPPMGPSLANDFMTVIFASHFVLFTDGMQFVAGIMLILDRYVPFALVVSAAVLYNMFAFHITMQPIGIIAPIVLTGFWVILARQYRTVLMPLLAETA